LWSCPPATCCWGAGMARWPSWLRRQRRAPPTQRCDPTKCASPAHPAHAAPVVCSLHMHPTKLMHPTNAPHKCTSQRAPPPHLPRNCSLHMHPTKLMHPTSAPHHRTPQMHPPTRPTPAPAPQLLKKMAITASLRLEGGVTSIALDCSQHVRPLLCPTLPSAACPPFHTCPALHAGCAPSRAWAGAPVLTGSCMPPPPRPSLQGASTSGGPSHRSKRALAAAAASAAVFCAYVGTSACNVYKVTAYGDGRWVGVGA